jgi:hypothetical protein
MAQSACWKETLVRRETSLQRLLLVQHGADAVIELPGKLSSVETASMHSDGGMLLF